jgi:hypothetical protein
MTDLYHSGNLVESVSIIYADPERGPGCSVLRDTVCILGLFGIDMRNYEPPRCEIIPEIRIYRLLSEIPDRDA